MPHIFECPKCGTDIGDEDGPGHHDDDVQIFGTGNPTPLAQSNRCPKCLSTNLEMGFGLAGGGYGPYSYCHNCGIVVNKSQDSI